MRTCRSLFRIAQRGCAAVLLSLAGVSRLDAQSTALWRYSASAEISSFAVTPPGAARYRSYYPAPPIGRFGQIRTVLPRVALDVTSYSHAQSRANRTGVPQTYRRYDNPFLSVRYAAADAARDYVYILTSEKDSTGETRSSMVKVSKDRNRVEGRVWLSDKHPDFAVDPIGGVVYVKTGAQELAAFKF